ncbi:MAG: biotin--[acetyl-CoA-carboxylase] ligase [Phototrophicales bacterium]|nr:MAG: biotin--[acetyl-CoA-carboxylase] ligase [Phototrophicales bacterium]RMG75207.1 MAG: biotin--[acetyl-CoA-carboxylase] ligase [Chloroflexota bacterium]
MMTEQQLQQALQDRPFRYYPQVDSTQDIALAWLRDGAEAGAAVICDEQLKGRGRQGRVWHTPPGVALALSVILKPIPSGMKHITMLGALAIADMLDSLGMQDVTIKWPNDVRLQGRKVCGVLPEAAWDGDRLLGVALGMGVNVRVDFTGTDLEYTAISIEPVLGRTVDRVQLIQTLLQRVDFWAMRLGTPELFEAWKSRLDTLGQMVVVNGISGRAEAVNRDGALLVRDGAGMLHTIIAGDILMT